jgi:exoribonuclease R
MKYGGDDDNFRIVNIDPLGCVDIDDAFHWSRDDPDHIYIHIADLSSIAKNYPKLVS